MVKVALQYNTFQNSGWQLHLTLGQIQPTALFCMAYKQWYFYILKGLLKKKRSKCAKEDNACSAWNTYYLAF